jgi:hypothetical protein
MQQPHTGLAHSFILMDDDMLLSAPWSVADFLGPGGNEVIAGEWLCRGIVHACVWRHGSRWSTPRQGKRRQLPALGAAAPADTNCRACACGVRSCRHVYVGVRRLGGRRGAAQPVSWLARGPGRCLQRHVWPVAACHASTWAVLHAAALAEAAGRQDSAHVGGDTAPPRQVRVGGACWRVWAP